MEDLIIGSALERWLASGERSRARLGNLVRHYADTYGYAGDRQALVETAWKRAQVVRWHDDIGD